MIRPKQLQFLQSLHYIAVVSFKQKFVLLLNFAYEHTCNLSFSTQVSPLNNLHFFLAL
jgi:hypothetical protein